MGGGGAQKSMCVHSHHEREARSTLQPGKVLGSTRCFLFTLSHFLKEKLPPTLMQIE